MRKITDADIVNGHYAGDCDLRGYGHPLPAGLTTIGGYCYLRDYAHALPAGLTTIGGYCYLRDYAHALRDYAHALPAGLTTIGGYCDLRGYGHPLPAGLTTIGGYCYLGGYAHAHHAGKDSRGYLFSALQLAGGNLRVIAGCRNFSVAEARAHWRKGTEQRDLAEKAIAMAGAPK